MEIALGKDLTNFPRANSNVIRRFMPNKVSRRRKDSIILKYQN